MAMSGTLVMVLGMGIVFVLLGILAVLSWGLERLFRAPPEKKEKELKSDVEAVITLALAYHIGRKGVIHLERVGESVWMQHGRVYA